MGRGKRVPALTTGSPGAPSLGSVPSARGSAMNRQPPHRSPADLRPAFLFALLLYLLVSLVLVVSLGMAGVASSAPLHPLPGHGL
jgi:hypothetical protein